MNTNFMLFFLILLTVALNTGAQMLLKLGSGQEPLNIFLFGGVCLYGLSTVIYILVLGKFNLSIAYPVVIGLTIFATTLASNLILKEKILFSQWIGIGLILSGIWSIAITKNF